MVHLGNHGCLVLKQQGYAYQRYDDPPMPTSYVPEISSLYHTYYDPTCICCLPEKVYLTHLPEETDGCPFVRFDILPHQAIPILSTMPRRLLAE